MARALTLLVLLCGCASVPEPPATSLAKVRSWLALGCSSADRALAVAETVSTGPTSPDASVTADAAGEAGE